MRQDFPHDDGLEKASPFKKAATFACFFISEKPVLDSLNTDTKKHLSGHEPRR